MPAHDTMRNDRRANLRRSTLTYSSRLADLNRAHSCGRLAAHAQATLPGPTAAEAHRPALVISHRARQAPAVPN